jgi:hypothetical protein
VTVTSPRTLSKLALAGVLAAGAVTLAPPSAGAHVTATSAHQAVPVRAKVVTLRSSAHKVTISDATFRPGVTEFRIRATSGKHSSIGIVRTAHLQRAFKVLQTALGGGPGSANAMAAFDRLVTAYSGGPEGARWQVRLPKGHYYAIDTSTNNLTPFQVAGERRTGRMVRPTSLVWATKDNQFRTSGPLNGPWVGFSNRSREIHFLEANRVQADVTAKDVRQALKSPDDPSWGLPGGFFFEIQSPGVTSVHRQDVKPPRYLLMCWMPSEQMDGMPHAMMGMWLLVDGGDG